MPSFTIQQNEKFKEVSTSEFYIEIDEGDYTGLSFVFGPIKFLGEDEEGNGRIEFDYDLLFIPERIDISEHRSNIEHMIGMILHNILEDAAKKQEGDNINEAGNIDPEQSVEG